MPISQPGSSSSVSALGQPDRLYLEHLLCDVNANTSNLHLGLLLHLPLGIHIASLAHRDAVYGEEESIPLEWTA